MKNTIPFLLFILFFLVPVNVFGAESTYHIGPGDALEVSVWKDEDLTKQLVVPPDGVISFPLAGDIDVTRMTVPMLRAAITEKLKEYIPDATVSVLLLKIESMAAYVIGKVNKPGAFPINMETNVMQVLAMAGGLNPYASSKNIIVLRQQGGKSIEIPFNYDEVENGKNLDQNILLKRGDVVVVP